MDTVGRKQPRYNKINKTKHFKKVFTFVLFRVIIESQRKCEQNEKEIGT